MLLLSCLPSERLSADGARERLDPGVHSHVGIEVATSEPLAAGRAQHLLPGLVPREVLLQILLGGHAPAADPADELGLVVPVLHVGLERVKVLAEVPADVADDRRRVAVVLLHVVVQGLLDLELLAADVAGEIVAVGVQPYVVVLQGALVVALVLAHAAVVHLPPVDLVDVGGQVSTEPERPRAVRALVPVLLQVLREIALVQEPPTTMVALQTGR